jgi:hypothetical protein
VVKDFIVVEFDYTKFNVFQKDEQLEPAVPYDLYHPPEDMWTLKQVDIGEVTFELSSAAYL